MASEENSPKQKQKINCSRPRAIHSLSEAVMDIAHTTFSSYCNGNISYKNQILQVFKTSLLSNIQTDGQPLNGDEVDIVTAAEYEPFDKEKQYHMEHVLMDHFDRQIVNTTRLRKVGSAKVRHAVKRLCRAETKYYSGLTVTAQLSTEESMETDVVAPTVCVGDVTCRLQGGDENCSSIIQKCEDMMKKSRDLTQALQILQRSEKHEFMDETPPSTPNAEYELLSHRAKKVSKKLLT